MRTRERLGRRRHVDVEQHAVDHVDDAVRREDVGNSHASTVEGSYRFGTVERDRIDRHLDSAQPAGYRIDAFERRDISWIRRKRVEVDRAQPAGHDVA